MLCYFEFTILTFDCIYHQHHIFGIISLKTRIFRTPRWCRPVSSRHSLRKGPDRCVVRLSVARLSVTIALLRRLLRAIKENSIFHFSSKHWKNTQKRLNNSNTEHFYRKRYRNSEKLPRSPILDRKIQKISKNSTF